MASTVAFTKQGSEPFTESGTDGSLRCAALSFGKSSKQASVTTAFDLNFPCTQHTQATRPASINHPLF